MENRRRLIPLLAVIALAAAVLAPGLAAAQSENPMNRSVQMLTVEVLSERRHDPNAFTQGLFLHDGLFYESTGRYGESTVRAVDPATGEVQQQIEVPEEYFGEGLALVGDSLVMLTWQEQEAFVFDRDTFTQTGTFAYEGEGWGLCFDGNSLVMSDGSSILQYRDPETFEVRHTVNVVRADGRALPLLNELECVAGHVWANVFTTNFIVRIDESGLVRAVYDLANLLTAEERANLGPEAVLNGIAWKEASGTFLVTGKLWPWMFELQID